MHCFSTHPSGSVHPLYTAIEMSCNGIGYRYLFSFTIGN